MFYLDTLYQHFWSLFHSYLILSEKVLKKFAHSKFASFVQQVIRPAGYPANETGYPAGYRISKKAGYPASRYNPSIKFLIYFLRLHVEQEFRCKNLTHQQALTNTIPFLTIIKLYILYKQDIIFELIQY